jgi:hypothetical protein
METKLKSPMAEVLARFEQAVLSPVVPGELAEWTDEAYRSIEALRSTLEESAKTVHREIYKTIADADPEMLARVEKLQDEDDELLVAVNELLEKAKTVRTVGGTVEPDEERAHKSLDGFVKAAEAILIRVKKQEQSIDVWQRESETRDRGVKD